MPPRTTSDVNATQAYTTLRERARLTHLTLRLERDVTWLLPQHLHGQGQLYSKQLKIIQVLPIQSYEPGWGIYVPFFPFCVLESQNTKRSTEGEEADQIKAKRGLTPKAQSNENGRDLLYDYLTQDRGGLSGGGF
ncbi:hypothetical protein MMC24_000519 [Lignoscripta atroalba]|nr:hypothetical protein [Lignoscripta atroalba]